MKLLTKERIRGIIEQFINNCENNDVTRFGFDESFWETTSWCEEHWEDDDSEEKKRSLLDKYLMKFGYHVLEEEGALSKEELIENYFIN